MSNEWIIDVLTDLRSFAQNNGMDATAAELEDACLVALAELASKRAGDMGLAAGNEGEQRKPHQRHTESDVA